MNKILITLLAALFSFGGFTAIATPAQAIESRKACVEYDGGDINTCLTAYFKKQKDGSGIVQTGEAIRTGNCNDLEEQNPYLGSWFRLAKTGTDKIVRAQYQGAHPCEFYRPVSNGKGAERGPTTLRYEVKARVQGHWDWNLALGVQMNTNGTSGEAYSWASYTNLRPMHRGQIR